MTTSKQNTANKENARKSTGPKTAAGKARASMNAATHGLTAEKVVIPGEAPKDFEALRKDVYQQLEPVGVLEEQLVERAAACLWRLRRIPRLETATFVYHSLTSDLTLSVEAELKSRMTIMPWNSPDLIPGDVEDAREARQKLGRLMMIEAALLSATFEAAERTLNGLTRYEATVERSFYRVLQELERMQEQRRAREASEPVNGASRESLAPRKRTRSTSG